MLDAVVLGDPWHPTVGPSVDLDRAIVSGIDGCVNVEHLVFDPLGFPRTVDSQWLTDDHHQPISQFVAVFADNLVAATFELWLDGPWYKPECSDRFFDELASKPCCDGDAAVLPRISSGQEVEISLPHRREVGTTVRRTDVFWTDASGRPHGPETRLTALLRIGRAITTIEVVESGEDGVVVTSVEEFESALDVVITAGIAQLPQREPQRAGLPALGSALTTANLGDDPPHLMVDLVGWSATEYQTQDFVTGPDDAAWHALELMGEGSIWDAPRAVVTVMTGDLSADFMGDRVSIGSVRGTIRAESMDGVPVVSVSWKPDLTYFAVVNASRIDVDVALAIARAVTIVEGAPHVEPVPDVITHVRPVSQPRRWAMYAFGTGERSLQVSCSQGAASGGVMYPSATGSRSVDGVEIGFQLGSAAWQSGLASAAWVTGEWFCQMAVRPQPGGVATAMFTDDELTDVLGALVVVDQATFESGLADARVFVGGEQVQP